MRKKIIIILVGCFIFAAIGVGAIFFSRHFSFTNNENIVFAFICGIVMAIDAIVTLSLVEEQI